MRVLVAWDDPKEAELLELYLNTDNEVVFAADAEDAGRHAHAGPWDAVLLAMTFPDTPDQGFALFQQLRQDLPGVPAVVACRPSEMIALPRFLIQGLRFYIIRDLQGDYVFLVSATLDSAIQDAQAEAARKLAEHLRQEINGVRLLQEAIIPHGLTPPDGYRVAARYEPSQVTMLTGQPVVMAGGDYYDLFCPEPHTLVALIGDASGHGLKACMSIMTMHTLVRMLGRSAFSDTAAFVGRINELLCSNSIIQSGGGFITLLYAALDTTNHTVSWTSAGHPPPLLQRLDNNEVLPVGANSDGGPPLGIAEGLEYEAYQLTLPPRSRLLLYSDGLPDALPPDGGTNAFGVEGIRQTLRDCHEQSLDETLDRLFQASQDYTGDEGRHDDSSAVLVERID